MITILLHNFRFGGTQFLAAWRSVWEERYIARQGLQVVLILVLSVLGTGGNRS